VVTGASSGIGEQAALFYASQGASVVLMARRENLLIEVCSFVKIYCKSTFFVYYSFIQSIILLFVLYHSFGITAMCI